MPTTYIDSRNRRLKTNQYSVTDYSRTIDHGRGVPGIFLKYDIEPLTMTVRERTSSLTQFLVRLSGILGGIWVCTGFAFRVTSRLGTVAAQTIQGRSETPEAYAASYSQRPSYSEKRSSSGGWLRSAPSAPDLTAPLAGMREKATNAWGNMGMGHRKVDSVQQRVMSEEGRAW